jgi:hypothetical protein
VLDALGEVDAQHFDGCATDRSLAPQNSAIPRKVLVPVIVAGIVERLQLIAFRIVSGDICPFVTVARQAGEGEIGRSRGSCMLLGSS